MYAGPKYTKVRNDFLERRDIGAVDMVILIYLHGRKRSDGQPWDVNAEQIQKALNLGREAVRAAIRRLKADGWLTDHKAARDSLGRITRRKAQVISSRCGEVVAETAISSQVGTWNGKPVPGITSNGKPVPGVTDASQVSPGGNLERQTGSKSSNEGLSDKGQSNEERSSMNDDPWACDDLDQILQPFKVSEATDSGDLPESGAERDSSSFGFDNASFGSDSSSSSSEDHPANDPWAAAHPLTDEERERDEEFSRRQLELERQEGSYQPPASGVPEITGHEAHLEAEDGRFQRYVKFGEECERCYGSKSC